METNAGANNTYAFTMPAGAVTVRAAFVKPLTDAMIAAIPAQTYTGAAIQPTVTLTDGETTLTLGTDYTVAYSNNTNAGTATVTVTGKGNYAGTATATFTIRGVTGSVSGSTLTYSVIDAPDNALLIAAWYDGSGKMLGMASTDVGMGSTTNAALDGVGDGAAVCKLMLLDKTTCVPLCAFAVIHL